MKNQLLPNEERIEESSLIDSADQITQVQKKCNFKKIIGIIIIIVGIIFGFYISSLAMFGMSSVSKNRFLGFFFQLVISFLTVFGLTLIGMIIAPFYKTNKKKQIIISAIIIFICYIISLTLYLLMFYLPVEQMTEFKRIPSGFWELSTGSKIAYYEYGNNSDNKYPIIYVHGGPGSPANSKDEFIEPLTMMGYRVYQYDQVGCGKSSRLDNCNKYTLSRHVEDLEGIRKSIGTEKINIICHSFGGTLSSNYIARYPNRVDNCFFISPGIMWAGDKTVSSINENGTKDEIKSFLKNPRYLFAQAISMIFPPNGLFVLMDEEDLDNLFMKFHDDLNMMPGSGEFYNSKGAGYGFWANVMTGRSMMKSPSPYKKLTKFVGRSLVVKGQYDYVSFRATLQYRDHIPNSTLITIDGMGHAVGSDQIDEVFSNIKMFLLNGTTVNPPYYGNDSPWN